MIMETLEKLFQIVVEEDKEYQQWDPPRRCVVNAFILNEKDHSEFRSKNNPMMSRYIKNTFRGLPVILKAGYDGPPFILADDREEFYLDKKLVWIR